MNITNISTHSSTKSVGNSGEQFVTEYLQNNGYTIRARNYQRRFGEIDIIAQKNDTLAFVEVKTRRSRFCDPTEVITISKQRKLLNTAKDFLAHNQITEMHCRFDVALVLSHHNKLAIEYISDAFHE